MIDRLYEFAELQVAYEYHAAKLRSKRMKRWILFACFCLALGCGVAVRIWG